MSSPEKAPETFDQRLTAVLKGLLGPDFFLAHPELRSIGVVLDYRAGLNDAPGVNKGLWLGPQGSVVEPAAIMGSLFQTINLLRAQLDRVEALGQVRSKQLVDLTEQLKQKQEALLRAGEHEKTKTAQRPEPGTAGTGATGPAG